MSFPNFDKGPKKVILQKVSLRMTWPQNTHVKPITRTALCCCHKISNLWLIWWGHLVTLIRCKAKTKSMLEKSFLRECSFFHSLLFEGMAILAFDTKHISEERAGWFTLIALMMYFDCKCYVISVFLAVPWFGLQCVIVVFPDHTHLLLLLLIKLYTRQTDWENMVQLFNAESHANGIKAVHGIDDTIAKFVFDKCVEEKCFVSLFCCFTSQVNSYGHGGTVSSPNHTFSWAGLNKRLTSNSCTYFRL